MGSPLGCLLSFFIAILVFIGVFLLTIIGKVKRIMNSFSPRHKAGNNSSAQQQTDSQNEQNYSQHTNSSRKSSPHHKIFDDDEGEYVDFEEIK